MTEAVRFADLIEHEIGGGWGDDEPTSVTTDGAFVIRGTDIPRALLGDVSAVPFRFHKPSNLRPRTLQHNDLVFEVSGGSKGQPVGRALLVNQRLLDRVGGPAMCASFCKLIRLDPELSNPRYVFRRLQLAYYSGELDAFQVQSTGITNFQWKPFLERFGLSLPDPKTQARVADILDTFDELINNNRRRVELLEEMARTVYQEWFVRFRYPGHDEVPLVASPTGPIPDGWETLTVGDVLELRYGKALKKEHRKGGPVAVVSSAGVVGWHDEALVQGPTVVVGRKGNVGSVTWVDGDAWPIDTSYFVVSPLPLRYVAEQLRGTEFLNTHAAVPGLSRDQAYSRPFLRPKAALMVAFDGFAGTLAGEATALGRASRHLAEVRDFLLPRLITGQIDVSDLDLEAVIATATA